MAMEFMQYPYDREATSEEVSTLNHGNLVVYFCETTKQECMLSISGESSLALIICRNNLEKLKRELMRRLLTSKNSLKRGQNMEDKPMGRRFTIPNEYDPTTGVIIGGDINCRHDYPEELKDIQNAIISWQCMRCWQTRIYKKEALSKKYIRT